MSSIVQSIRSATTSVVSRPKTIRRPPVIDIESFASQLTDCCQRMWLIAAAVTGDRAEADDIVQQASMIGLQKRADFAAGTNFAAWMSQIVRLTALNYRKKSGRRNLRISDPVRMDKSISASA